MTNYNAQAYGKMVEGQTEQAQEITLKHIVIDWVEAWREGDPETETFDTVEVAEIALTNHAYDAPNDGCYNKVDFKVVLTNDVSYRGRIDLQYQHHTGYSIRQHIVNHLSWIAEEQIVLDHYNTTSAQIHQAIDLYNRVLA